MTTIAEVKKFHRKVCLSQGLSEDRFLADCQAIDLSVDGVRETKHGKRQFVFVTARFGKAAIYIIKVFNPLLGEGVGKPSPETLIGYVGFKNVFMAGSRVQPIFLEISSMTYQPILSSNSST